MKVTTSLGLKYLAKNKKRSRATITGIAIVTMLILTVLVLISSFRQYMVDIERNDKNWEAEFIDIKYSKAKEIEKDKNVKEVSLYYNFGYSKESSSNYNEVKGKFEEGSMFNKPFYMRAYDDNAIKNANLKLLSGRMPENSSEVIVSKIISEGDDTSPSILALDIGREIELTFNGEKKTYKIVGKVESLEEDNNTLSINRQGLVTYLDNNIINENLIINARILTNNLQKICSTCDNLIEKLNLKEIQNSSNKLSVEQSQIAQEMQNSLNEQFTQAGLDTSKKEEVDLDSKVTYNKELLNYELVSDVDSSFRDMLFILSFGLTLVISFAAIVVIYTTFKMSYGERIRELGILSSLGMNKKQRRNMLLKESFIIGTIGIIIRNYLRTNIFIFFSSYFTDKY